jgi:DNA-binding NarL/FixJ family response regulator
LRSVTRARACAAPEEVATVPRYGPKGLSATPAPVRLLIVDDDPAFVGALTALLAQEERIEVVGTAANGEEAMRLPLLLRPDVVTMDIEMPVTDGVEATRMICASLTTTRVVVLNASEFAARVESAREAGAAVYITKSRAPTELVGTIVAVHRGENFLFVAMR